MAAHSSILAWRIPWKEEPGKPSPEGTKELDMTEVTSHAHAKPISFSVSSHFKVKMDFFICPCLG